MNGSDITVQANGERTQVVGWFVQVIGTMAMLFGTVLALGALPDIADGRFVEGSDFTAFFILLVSALVIGFSFIVIGVIVGVSGRARVRREGGEVRPLRSVLSGWQRSVGLMVIFIAFVALMASIGRVLFEIATSSR